MSVSFHNNQLKIHGIIFCARTEARWLGLMCIRCFRMCVTVNISRYRCMCELLNSRANQDKWHWTENSLFQLFRSFSSLFAYIKRHSYMKLYLILCVSALKMVFHCFLKLLSIRVYIASKLTPTFQFFAAIFPSPRQLCVILSKISLIYFPLIYSYTHRHIQPLLPFT